MYKIGDGFAFLSDLEGIFYKAGHVNLIVDKKVTARSFRTLGGYFLTVHILFSVGSAW
ncbi:hypothetical protein GCM10008014_09520 [Paenibacillus silvae]|uniref:Uncharacterized protein n=1 Tax=Paenibacillus silvae TaxID=1325358 RepID=A0ABQ1Z3R5_9BACL|nr:hypothetical protein GCM10008014_09520 [Paenibacillus silvae]